MGLENLREMFLWEKLVVKKEKKNVLVVEELWLSVNGDKNKMCFILELDEPQLHHNPTFLFSLQVREPPLHTFNTEML